MQPAYLTCQSWALRASSARAGRSGGASASLPAAGSGSPHPQRPQRTGSARRDDANASSADTYWKEKLRDAAVGVGDVILLAGFVAVMLYDLLLFGR